MDEIISEILELLRAGETLDEKAIGALLARHNREAGGPVRAFSKKQLVPHYLKVKEHKPKQWTRWNVDDALEQRFFATLRMKPRRTASGVATITVITKPWPCSSNCLYCPNDVRMPKSYLSNEPACQRAERNFFDPYLQVASRLRALVNMGHPTSKIELIVLGGTFSDYPQSYQIWFIEQLFEALNDADCLEEKAQVRRKVYKRDGLSNEADELAEATSEQQQLVYAGKTSYNKAVELLYRHNPAWQITETWQNASLELLAQEQRKNESAQHRVVGLVVETRPDTVSAESLKLLRRLGCTKLQMGIQSLNPEILAANRRAPGSDPEAPARALDLARLFGFKTHTHFMLNLFGATPESDINEYRRFMTERPWQPDEVKIYPCSLVKGTGLVNEYERGTWRPYSEDELLDVLAADVLATPSFTRISRMIRDISAQDIMVGNKKGNLRQLVDQRVAQTGKPVREIRAREINSESAPLEQLCIRCTEYETTHTRERFLEWVTPENHIAGFLRLSLPDQDFVRSHPELAVRPGQAMIREVHVYGRVADVGTGHAANAQHSGLGRQLVEEACRLARAEGFAEINVISSVGTRNYYRKLGFFDTGLYQTRPLE